jgi:Tetratricopeptide repeat
MGSDLDAANADALAHAVALVAKGQDEAAKQAYLDILRRDPTHFHALNELGTLALSGGFRSAARTAYQQAVKHHPGNKIAHVNLANVLREQQDLAGARLHYEEALSIDADFHEAHQGMAWVLSQLGEEGADQHRQRGYAGHAVVSQAYRGIGTGVPVLMLVSVHAGNVATQLWLNDRHFALTAIYTEFYDAGMTLPPHALLVNAIGDADLCELALDRAEQIAARSSAPMINQPAHVRLTGRADNARRLSTIDGVIAPVIRAFSPAAAPSAAELDFPLLLRRPGFHNGEHFVRVDTSAALAPAIAALAGDELLAIQYLDARGADGMTRKYRVMFIDGIAYPLHLAIAGDWKVHYIKSEMAHNVAYRDEERRFLEEMPRVLGARAMAALRRICTTLDLEYAGIDFALAPDDSVLLFEANATMIVLPPGPEPMWDYRRRAIDNVLQAATRMLLRHAGQDRAAMREGE